MSTCDIQQDSERVTFWDIKQYMKTVKRVDNANKLCHELSALIVERANIENAYADNLKKWAARWQTLMDSGIEYGTGRQPWLAVCQEAENISQMHKSTHDKLVTEIQTSVRNWTKNNFHKTQFPPQTLKEAKQFENQFETAQKPWCRKLKKVSQCKKDYFQACKTVNSLKVHVENAKSDPTGATEQDLKREMKLRKIQDKLKKAETDEEKLKELYEDSLQDLDSDKSRYLQDMSMVFDQCQDFEKTRLIYFHDVFISLHQALDLTKKTEINSIYSSLKVNIDKSKPEEDLVLWSNQFGVNMPFLMPVFEDYSPELTAISKKKSVLDSTVGSGTVTLTGISAMNTSQNNDYYGVNPKPTHSSANATDEDNINNNISSSNNNDAVTTTTAASAVSADMYDDSNMLFDDGRPGIPVRALYDYQGVEDDEISFVAGDIFEKLEDEDEQGWSKGRKGGRVGLYPANYVEVCK